MGRTCLVVSLFITAVVLLAIGLCGLFVYPIYYNNESSLVKGSTVYDKWVAPDYPIYMKYYFFNFTNADEFIYNNPNGDVIPSVEDIGCLSYREYPVKYDIQFDDDDRKVLYYNNKSYVYDEETSDLAENDTVVVPNILLFTLMNTDGVPLLIEGKVNEMFGSGIYEQVNAASPFYEVEVGNLIWGTEPNELLVYLKEHSTAMARLIPSTYFSLQVNNTNDGLYEIYTGKGHDNDNRGNIIMWNDLTALTYWDGGNTSSTCNMINGTDGTIYPIDLSKNERLYIFNTQICRSIFLVSDGDEKIDGVSTTRFYAPKEVFELDFEDNVCFCPDGELSECLPDGLMDASTCYQEIIAQQLGLSAELSISVIVSSPEFLYANESTIATINGFNPNQEEHETVINLDLETGIILSGAKRIQINTRLNQFWFLGSARLDSMNNLPKDWEYTVPMFWGEEMLVPDDDLTGLVLMIHRVNISVLCLSYIFIGIAAILLIAAIVLVIFSSRKSKDYDLGSSKTPLMTSNY